MTPRLVRDENGTQYILTPVREDRELVGRDYICERAGISLATLSRSPWYFPDFGEAIAGTRGKKPYRKGQVDDWLAIPTSKRRQMYMRRKNEADK